jgi:hypothetical protein
MAFLGNTPTTQAFTPAVDFFSGNASTTAFTLSRPVASVAQVQVVVNNVPQKPSDAYTVSSNTITFTSAPSSGTNNIYVYYTSPITQVIAPGQGTVGLTALTATGTASSSTFLRGDNSWQTVSVTPTAVSDQDNTSTGYFDLPAGTTAQRPASPLVGMMRYNTTISQYEAYQSTGWAVIYAYTSYPVSYLIVAGGGGGGGAQSTVNNGGSAGAGGLLQGTSTLSAGTTYSFVVGGGGAGGAGGSPTNGTQGTNSTGLSLTAIGGGYGSGNSNGGNGGSGGGGGGVGSATSGGTATSGQGNAGSGGPGNFNPGAGGGAGGAASGSTAGVGLSVSITGSAVTYAAGGTAVSANTGNGGTGGGGNNAGGTGSSGVVILAVPTINYTGTTTGSPTVTTSGANTILKFTSSGSYTA